MVDQYEHLVSVIGGKIVDGATAEVTTEEPATETTVETPAAETVVTETPPANTESTPNAEVPNTEKVVTETPASTTTQEAVVRETVRDMSEGEMLEKLFPGKFKNKTEIEDFYSKAIIPKNDLVRKMNDFDKDPEILIRANKLDIATLTDKEAVIQQMMIEKGRSREDAEISFNDEFALAMADPASREHDHTPQQIRAAQLRLQDKAEEAKKSLETWKVSATATGISPEQQALIDNNNREFEAKIQAYQQGITSTIDSYNKLDFELAITTPDKKEVKENFSFGVSDEVKKTAKEILSDPRNMVEKILNRYGSGDKGYENLARLIFAAEHLPEIVSQVGSHSYGKGMEALTREVKPGQVDAGAVTTTAPPTTKTREDALIEYFKNNS